MNSQPHRRLISVFSFQLFSIFLLAIPARAILDTNTNQLSDVWEKLYHSNTLPVPKLLATDDPDQDGWNNATECAAGTNPFLAEATALRDSLAVTPSAVPGIHYLSSPTRFGKAYQIQVTQNLVTWYDQGTPYLGNGRPLEDIVQATLEDDSPAPRVFWRMGITDTDTDGDGLTDWEEAQLETNPNAPDTDGDGLFDLYEAERPDLYNPLLRDQDGDGVWDNVDGTPTVNNNDPAKGGDPDGGNLAAAFSANLEGFWDFETTTGIFPKLFPDRSGHNRTATGGLDGALDGGMPSKYTRIGPGTVTIPKDALQNQAAYTISAWFKLGSGTVATTTARWQVLWSLYDQQGVGPWPQYNPHGQGTVLMVRGKTATSTQPASEEWFIGKYQQSTYSGEPSYTNGNPKTIFDGRFFNRPTGATDDARWHHLAILCATGTTGQQVYLDGTLADEGPLKVGAVDYDADTRFLFGNIAPTSSATQLNEGYIDRLRVHSRSLTAAEITALRCQDIDHDGLWDITESATRKKAYATPGHPAPYPPVLPSLADYHFSPYYTNDSSGDSDQDSFKKTYTELDEQAHGTSLSEPDTDGDGLPDGFEIEYNLNPLTPWIPAIGTIPAHPDTTEAIAHSDSDGADNLTEYLNHTNPLDPDTDGDEVGDAQEIADGSDPNHSGDHGVPPPGTPEDISFHVYGDYTQWEATLTGKGPDDWRVRRFRMTAPGTTTTQDLQLLPGNSYTFALTYLHTKPDQNVPWYCWEAGIKGAGDTEFQTAPAFTLNGKWLVDNSGALLADHSHSQGENKVKEKKAVTLAPADLDLIKPGTETDATPTEIAEDKEDSEGGVANVNWDDDNFSAPNGGHGKLVFKSDFEDPPGTIAENDLIRLKLHKANAAGTVTARLKFENTHIKLWKEGNRTGPVTSEATEFVLADDIIVYVEGVKLTPSGQPVNIQTQIKVGGGAYQPGDSVNIHVATPIITFQAKIAWVGGAASKNLAEQLHHKDYLGKYRIDDRNNTVILKGKNQQGQVLYYSVDMVDICPIDPVGKRKKNPPEIVVRTPHLDKEFKMALGVQGAHVFCNGHSNFGLGPNFTPGGTSTVDDYTNLSGRGITAIILKSNDPEDGPGGNPMKLLDHGGPAFALRAGDVVVSTTNYMVPVPDVEKFDGKPVGAVLQKHTDPDGTPFHFIREVEFKNWITIVKSSGDVPALRYGSCFMAGCNTGRAFSESLNHGVLLYTKDESQMPLGKNSASIPGDLKTAAPGDDPMSWVDAHYVRMMVEGKSWAAICAFLNNNFSGEWPDDAQGNPVTPDIYGHHLF